MEPFSATASAIGLVVDVAKVIQYLREVKNALQTIDEDIDSLIEELKFLEKFHGSLRKECDQQRHKLGLDTSQPDLWDSFDHTLRDAEAAYRQFEKELRRVYGDDPKRQGLLDALQKQHRLRGRMPKLKGWRDSLHHHNAVLQTCLQMITFTKQDLAQQDIVANFNAVLEGLRATTKASMEASEQQWYQHDHIFDAHAYQAFNKSSVAALERLETGFRSMERTAKTKKHFDTPQALDSCYIGREEESQKLASAFFTPTNDRQVQQLRFVVYGVGGAGKTQFCCKFAEDYQDRFSGVFWVDARSHDQLQHTLSQNVASIGGVAHNHVAALHWLSNNEGWLLIYDNADDPTIELDKYFPRGRNGCILITTRNPEFRWLGNTEPRGLRFQEMREADAYLLLLNITGHTESSSAELRPFAKRIVKTLGYLALAISVAGSVIRRGFCRFQDYLKHFQEEWREFGITLVRRRHSERATRLIGLCSVFARARCTDMRARERRVEATFDISLKAIEGKDTTESKDALQLLKTFATLHSENVRFDFLKHCVENARKEQEKKAAEPKSYPVIPQTWGQYAQELWIWLMTPAQRAEKFAILPDVLRHGRSKQVLDDATESRVRRAMQHLTQYSLTSWNEKTDSWSMHPMVHRWARASLAMRLGEQLVWCEAAATLLSNCILIGSNDEVLMQHLLPHVDEVLDRQNSLEKRTEYKRMGRLKPWPIFESGFSPHRAMMFAKFSIVYSQNGRFEKAEPLQRAVQSFAVKMRGFEAPSTRLITMSLAVTLSQLSRSDDSARLLEELLDNCERVCGPGHRDTYVAKLRLAGSRLHQGRVADAKTLCEDAKDGLSRVVGEEDEETLNAMDILASATILSGTPNAVAEAQQLNRHTWRTRERLLGAEHIKTIDSRQEFYTTSFWRSDRYQHFEAEKGLTKIVEIRKERQGREHPWTLLAMLYLARVKVELHDFDAAEVIFDEGLPIAKRSFGMDHVAVLFCRFHFGRMRVRQGRWAEARNELIDVTERQKTTLNGWGRYHYDRIGGLLELARAHHELGEYEECDEVVAEADRGFVNITVREHPWHKKLKADHASWKAQRATAAGSQESGNANGHERLAVAPEIDGA